MAEKATVQGHCLYLDLLKVTVKSDTPENMTINCDNRMILEATGKKCSDFTQMKSEMVERTCEHLNKLKSRNMIHTIGPIW